LIEGQGHAVGPEARQAGRDSPRLATP
jgi:hypothetical protein